MEEKLCLEKHSNINQRLDVHDKRLNSHSDRLDELEQYRSETKAEIKSLCQELKNLNGLMRWFMGLLIGAFISFFFYIVQQNIIN